MVEGKDGAFLVPIGAPSGAERYRDIVQDLVRCSCSDGSVVSVASTRHMPTTYSCTTSASRRARRYIIDGFQLTRNVRRTHLVLFVRSTLHVCTVARCALSNAAPSRPSAALSNASSAAPSNDALSNASIAAPSNAKPLKAAPSPAGSLQ